MEPTRTRPDSNKMRRFVPLGILVAVAVVIAVVVVVSGGNGDDDAGGNGGNGNGEGGGDSQLASGEELIRSGPMTPQKAELLGEDVDFGAECDEELGTVKIPSTYVPPCVAPFEGDNGGATSAGVTGDEITVVAYQADPELNPLATALIGEAGVDLDLGRGFETTEGYAELFSEHFELYGRSVKVEQFIGTGEASDAERARADAITIADRFKPFAVIGGPLQTTAFREELVARKIVCVGGCALAASEEDVADSNPYLIPTGMGVRQFTSLAAEMVEILDGDNAEFAGEDLRSKPRRFGFMCYESPEDPSEACDAFEEEMDDAGIELATVVPFYLDLNRMQEIAATAIAKLEDAGVTSVILASDPGSPIFLTEEATKQEYFPEWLIGPNVFVDLTLAGRRYGQDQWGHAFGLTALGARGPQETQEAYSLYQWQFGREPESNVYGAIAADVGLVFSGIHLAGAELTPTTFRDGVFRVPLQGGNPISPTVFRGRGGPWAEEWGEDYTDWFDLDDVAVIYWDSGATGEDEVGQEGTGMYRFANEGKRYLPGELPEGLGLFDDESSVTIFDDVPDEYLPPDYPSPRDGG